MSRLRASSARAAKADCRSRGRLGGGAPGLGLGRGGSALEPHRLSIRAGLLGERSPKRRVDWIGAVLRDRTSCQQGAKQNCERNAAHALTFAVIGMIGKD